jgi:lipid-binding SYLF domain-containing protein
MRTNRAAGLLAVYLVATGLATAANEAVERCEKAATVLDEVMGTPEQSIPSDLLSKAHCVAIVPGMKKVGLGLGGKYGKGLLSCRAADNKGWTAPTTIRIEGGSIGFQIGGSSTDIVLLVMNESGKSKLLSSKATLGADASVAGGPVGRTASAQTDVQMRAEILSYSRARGLFAGVSLEGASLRPAHQDNKRIYGRDVTPKQILAGEVEAPASVGVLARALSKHSMHEH